MVKSQTIRSTEMKSAITAADLWVLLDREFRRRRPRECSQCFVPLPFHVVPQNGPANWDVDIRHGCGKRCGLVLEELVLEQQRAHDLSPD
jgi:hypothetical protein